MCKNYTNFMVKSFKDELNNNLYAFVAKKSSCANCVNLTEFYNALVDHHEANN